MNKVYERSLKESETEKAERELEKQRFNEKILKEVGILE